MATASFSFQELRQADKVRLPDTERLTASDGVNLAYRRYAPHAPRAVLLFYHGGGAHSGAGYQFLGSGLQSQFETLVIMPDIRGHGASEGARGDASSVEQVWADVSTFIDFIHHKFPHLALFLGGHSSGAGMLLNYNSWTDRSAVDGYVFLSPRLGTLSKTDRPALSTPFAAVDASAFIANGVSHGSTHAHDYAVRFNYPEEMLAADPGMVASITVNMSKALTPSDPSAQFAALDRPLGLWIGEEDELFLPDKVLEFAHLPARGQILSHFSAIPGAKHLSILVCAHEVIGPWILQVAGK
jgi:acylglycerol lipase